MNGDPLPHSPARSSKSDRVRSFTTSSDTSASDRIAALRAARAARRQQREADARSPAQDAPDNIIDSSIDARESGTPSTRAAVAIPRLRVQSNSDRSHSPTLPSTPSRSNSTTTTPATRRLDDRASHDTPPPSVAPTLPPRAMTPSPSPPSSVSIAGGLLERLKAQRAARTSTDVASPPPDHASAIEAGPTSVRATPPTFSEGVGAPDVIFSESPSSTTASSPLSSSGARSSAVSEYSSSQVGHHFHQLSDVVEQSEQSSLSTWQAPLSRSGVAFDDRASSIIRPLQASPSARDVAIRSTSPRRPSRTMEALIAVRDKQSPALPSSRSPAIQPGAGSEAKGGSLFDNLSRRHVDASARLGGGSELSSASIHSHNAKCAPWSPGSAFEPTRAPDLAVTPPASGRSSPVRRVSPELARRAAIFVRSSPVGSAPFPTGPTRRLGCTQKATDPDGTGSVAGTHSSSALFPSLQSPSTDDEQLREAKLASAGTHELSAYQSEDKFSERPIVYEGPLLALEQGLPPVRRYCVLTDEALEDRPTDQSGAAARSIAFKMADCVGVDFEPAVEPEHLAMRPFAVRLRGGQRHLFAAEAPGERLRWLTELKSLIPTAHTSTIFRFESSCESPSAPELTRSLTPPGSFFSETRGTVRSWSLDKNNDHPLPPHMVPPLLSTPARLTSRDAVTHRDSAQRINNFDRISESRPREHTARTSLSPPPLPPKTTTYPTAPSRSFESQSTPTKGQSSADLGELSATSAPEAPSSLDHTLRELLAHLELDDMRKEAKSARSKRLRERLGAFKDRLASEKSSVSASRVADLAAKVEYLMAANDNLLRKQEQLETVLGDRARKLEAEEQELARRVELCLRSLIRPEEVAHDDQAGGVAPTLRPSRQPDTSTLTTRAGIHSASEKAEWIADLDRFQNEAMEARRMFSPSPACSSPLEASPKPRTPRLEATKRKLQVPVHSPMPQRASPNPAGLFAEDDLSYGAHSLPPRDPFAASGVVQGSAPLSTPVRSRPGARQHAVATSAPSLPSVTSWASSDVSRVEQTLAKILEGFEAQTANLAEQQVHQDRVSQVVSELAKWVAEDRSIRDLQFRELAQAIESVVQGIAKLPRRLSVEPDVSAYTPPPPAPLHLPDVDSDSDTLVPQPGGETTGRAVIQKPKARLRKGSGGLINPQSSFARAQAQAAESGKQDSGVKGPRMPGLRLWGAPDPVAHRDPRWGREDGSDAESQNDPDEGVGEVASAPVLEALRTDARLGQALEAIARTGEPGEEIDPALVSLTVLEILATMRDIAKKQDTLEAKEAAEKARNNGLTDREKAELEMKRTEIARIEARTLMSEQRTARINEMVAKLAERTDNADKLLREIAKNVHEGRKTQIDPALSEEVKKLLSGVRSGVDEHVKDFRGQLTSEVQRIFKEVGKLRDEKKALQSDIADLLKFQAKHGGKPPAAAVPSETSSPSKFSTKSGLPTSGFFGPRSPAP